MFYSIGPWEWRTDGTESYWAAPKGTVGLVDLRPLAACAAEGSHPLNFGFFATPERLGSDYIALGSGLEELLTTAQTDAWCQTVGISSLTGRKLLDVLWETLTVQADPEAIRRTFPIMPTWRGILELWLGGHSLLRSRRFMGVDDPSWPVIRRVIRGQYRSLHEAVREERSRDSQILGRRLATWMRKFDISDHRLFIPADLPIPDPLRPRTLVSDDFNRGDEALGASANWTVISGGFNVLNNKARPVNEYWNAARFESDLSSDDQYSQVEVWRYGIAGDSRSGPACRFDAASTNRATANFYACGFDRATLDDQLLKTINGTITILSDVAGSDPDGAIYKVSADGSSIKAYLAGSEILSATDSAITGHLRCGMEFFKLRWEADNFEAADLAAGVDYTETISDNLGIADATSRVSSFNRIFTENLGATDADTSLLSIIRSISDSEGISDVQSRISTVVRALSENLGIVDSRVLVLAVVRAFSESLSVSDSTTSIRGIVRTVSDALGVSDSEVVVSTVVRAMSESLGITDSQVLVRTVARVFSESLAVSDSETTIRTIIRAISDDLGISDSVITKEVALTLLVLASAIAMALELTSTLSSVPTLDGAESIDLVLTSTIKGGG